MTERDALPGRRRESLVDAIDRLIDVGTVISGDAIIRLAEVDLIHLDLRLLLAAIIGPPAPAEAGGEDSTPSGAPAGGSGAGSAGAGRALPRASSPRESGAPHGEGAEEASRGERPGERLDQGLGQLVVAVVELVRQLLERQAVRRVRAGTLDAQQQERLGGALQALEQRMVELREALGVTPSELDQAIGTVERMLDSQGTDPAAPAGQERRVS